MRRMATLLMGVLALGACGGNDRLSRDAFVKKAEAICAKGGAELQRENAKVFGDGSDAPTDAQIRGFVAFAGENANGQLDDIEKLRPPRNLDKDVKLAIQDSRDMLRAFVARATEKPQELDAIEEESSKIVKHHLSDLGADSCP